MEEEEEQQPSELVTFQNPFLSDTSSFIVRPEQQWIPAYSPRGVAGESPRNRTVTAIFREATGSDSVVDPKVMFPRSNNYNYNYYNNRQQEEQNQVNNNNNNNNNKAVKPKKKSFKFPNWFRHEKPAAPRIEEIGLPTDIQHTASVKWNPNTHTYESAAIPSALQQFMNRLNQNLEAQGINGLTPEEAKFMLKGQINQLPLDASERHKVHKSFNRLSVMCLQELGHIPPPLPPWNHSGDFEPYSLGPRRSTPLRPGTLSPRKSNYAAPPPLPPGPPPPRPPSTTRPGCPLPPIPYTEYEEVVEEEEQEDVMDILVTALVRLREGINPDLEDEDEEDSTASDFDDDDW